MYTYGYDLAQACARAAHEAGASWVVLCDTNGGSLPDEIHHIVRYVYVHLHHHILRSIVRYVYVHLHISRSRARARSLSLRSYEYTCVCCVWTSVCMHACMHACIYMTHTHAQRTAHAGGGDTSRHPLPQRLGTGRRQFAGSRGRWRAAGACSP